MPVPKLPPSILLLIIAGAACVTACAAETPAPEPEVDIPEGAVTQGLSGQQIVQAAKACVKHLAFQITTLAPIDSFDDFINNPVNRGRAGWNDRHLSGIDSNGRACADCHMGTENFQMSPSKVKERFDALQGCRVILPNADDPLFRPIDADDFRTNGAAASNYSNLKRGLVRITFNLPPQVKLIDPATNLPSAETSVDVWRSTPSIHNVAMTGEDTVGLIGDNNGAPIGPNPRGGYQLDGRVLTLPDQALGAFQNHAQVSSNPSVNLLNDIAAFESAQFSSSRVKSLSNAILSGATTFPDPTPNLTPLEAAGKVTFDRVCATCHGTAARPSGSVPTIGQRYHRIRSQCPRQPTRTPATSLLGFDDGFGVINLPACAPEQNALGRVYEFTLPTGAKQRQTSDDLGRAYFTGRPPDGNAVDIPSLYGVKNTAPYFHNNSAVDLEQVVEFYRVFFPAVARDFAPPALPVVVSTDGTHFDRFFVESESAGLVAYLKRL